MSDKKPKWYEVTVESFIGDALKQEGDLVQYSGEQGPNLRGPLSDKEVKDRLGDQAQPVEDEKAILDNREGELDEREAEIADREVKAQLREEELEAVEQGLNDRAKELDEREAKLAERERTAAPAETEEDDKPIEKQNVAELRVTAGEMGIEVPEGKSKAEIREMIKAKQEQGE